MITPAIVILGMFVIYPIFYMAYLSFFEWDLIQDKSFVGFENFITLFDDIIRTHSGDDSSKVSADILNQNAGMWFDSTADLTKNLQIVEENNFEINTAFLPKAKEYGVSTGGCNLVITSKTSDKEKQVAWEFIKWITSPEQAAISTVTTGYVPTSKLLQKQKQYKIYLKKDHNLRLL